MRYFFLAIIVLKLVWVQGQNLVPNPSFEEVWTYNVAEADSNYPPPLNFTLTNFEKLIKNWTINGHLWGTIQGFMHNEFYYFKQEMMDTSFFFNEEAKIEFSPRTGKSCDLRIFNSITTFHGYPEFFQNEYSYISNSLTKPLEKGKIYYIEYYVKKQEQGPFNPSDSLANIWYPSQLGLFLSDKVKPFTFQEMYTAIHNSLPPKNIPYPQDQLSYEASVSSLANRFYGKKKNTWERVCGFYTAQGGEQYLFIGNFNQKELWQESPYYGVVDVRNFPYFKQKGDYIRTNDIFMIDDVRIEEYRPGMFFKGEENQKVVICESDLPYKLELKDTYDAYKWQNGATTKKLNITKAGNYKVEVDGFGCIIKDSVNVEIQKKNVPQPIVKDTILCPTEFPFQITVVNPYTTKWSTGAIGNQITFLEEGKYWVSASNACETKSDTFLIQKIDTSVYQLKLPSTVLFCENSVLDSIMAIPSYFTNVKWETGDTNHIRTLKEKGIYSVHVQNRCLEKTAHIEVSHYPEQFFLQDTFMCEGNKYEPDISLDYDSYRWNTEDSTRKININSSGNYFLTAKNPCGTWSDSVLIRYIPKLNQRFENQTLLCAEGISQEIELSVSKDWKTILWSTGEKTSSIKVKEEGVYTVKTQNECQAIIDTVIIRNCPKDLKYRIEIPNIVTPNNDGKNDCFTFDYYNVFHPKILIYSRLGNLVTQLSSDSWCPTEETKTGMYYYQVIFETPKGEIQIKNGWLMLER